MKIAALTLMTAMVAAAAEPKQPQQKLTVYVRNDAPAPFTVLARALGVANQMFAKIGVRLEWRSGETPSASCTRCIGIELASHTPAALLPGALALRFMDASPISLSSDSDHEDLKIELSSPCVRKKSVRPAGGSRVRDFRACDPGRSCASWLIG